MNLNLTNCMHETHALRGKFELLLACEQASRRAQTGRGRGKGSLHGSLRIDNATTKNPADEFACQLSDLNQSARTGSKVQ